MALVHCILLIWSTDNVYLFLFPVFLLYFQDEALRTVSAILFVKLPVPQRLDLQSTIMQISYQVTLAELHFQ